MSSVRTLVFAVIGANAGVWAAGCTQVHLLGEVGSSSETSDGNCETCGPIPDVCEVVDLGGNEGVTIDIVPMNQWEQGACHEFYVTNETPDDLIWTRELRFGGTLDKFWNAEGEELNPTDWRFGGQASASNIVVLSGQTVVFGSCMVC